MKKMFPEAQAAMNWILRKKTLVDENDSIVDFGFKKTKQHNCVTMMRHTFSCCFERQTGVKTSGCGVQIVVNIAFHHSNPKVNFKIEISHSLAKISIMMTAVQRTSLFYSPIHLTSLCTIFLIKFGLNKNNEKKISNYACLMFKIESLSFQICQFIAFQLLPHLIPTRIIWLTLDQWFPKMGPRIS